MCFACVACFACLAYQAKSQFKSRSIANNVEIIIPVPNDVDSPTFKASIGSVAYLPDQVSPMLHSLLHWWYRYSTFFFSDTWTCLCTLWTMDAFLNRGILLCKLALPIRVGFLDCGSKSIDCRGCCLGFGGLWFYVYMPTPRGKCFVARPVHCVPRGPDVVRLCLTGRIPRAITMRLLSLSWLGWEHCWLVPLLVFNNSTVWKPNLWRYHCFCILHSRLPCIFA